MRTIKFRVWDEGKWYFFTIEESLKPGHWFDKNATIQQFTGMHDSNGVDIYEGDLIKFPEGNRDDIAEVVYSDIDGYWFANNCEGSRFHGCEVIGNIHEDPSVLKEHHGITPVKEYEK